MTALTLTQITKTLKNRPSVSVIFRYTVKGLTAPNGEKIFLKNLKSKGKIMVSCEDLIEFVLMCNSNGIANFQFKESFRG